jgi:hypothetical protein
MDEKLGKFIDNFADLVQLAQARSHRRQAGVQLLDTLTGYLGLAAEDLWRNRFRPTGSLMRTS